MQDKITTQRYVINSLKVWQTLNILEQPLQVKILFINRSVVDWTWGKASYHSVQNRVSYFLLFKNDMIEMYVTIILFSSLIRMWNLVSHWGRNVGCGYLRIGYLDLRGTRLLVNGWDCRMRIRIICTSHQILLEWLNQGEWDGQGV
jgi:hypothetical protein